MNNEVRLGILKLYDIAIKHHPEEITEFRLIIKTSDTLGDIVITNLTQMAGFIDIIKE